MIIGFSGSRHGMSQYQNGFVWDFLIKKHQQIYVAVHGDCIGSDAEFHDMCEELDIHVDIYPPVNDKFRAWKLPVMDKGTVYEAKTYGVRNALIVSRCDLFLATPHSIERVTGSGTWMTIELAQVNKVKTIVIPPVPIKETT